MKSEFNTLKTISASIASDPELATLQLTRPKFIDEMSMIRLDQDRLLFHGFKDFTVVSGKEVVSFVSNLRKKLQETLTVQEIAKEYPGCPDQLLDLLLSLSREGVLEESHILESGFSFETYNNFIAKNARKTGWYSSRLKIIERIRSQHVIILGSSEFGNNILSCLGEFGLTNLTDDIASLDDNSIVICQSTYPQDHPNCFNNVQNSATVVLMDIQEFGWSIGPVCGLRDVLGIVSLLEKETSPLNPSPSAFNLPSQTIYETATQQIFCYMMQLSDFFLHKRRIVTFWNGEGFTTQQYLIGNFGIYVSDDFIINEYKITDLKSFDKLNSMVEMPRKQEIAPTMHLWHYAEQNIKLGEVFPLPQNSNFTIPLVDFSSPTNKTDHVTQNGPKGCISAILFYSGGVYERQTVKRRLVPSGGNIGAVELYIVNFNSIILPNGVYRYCAVTHELEKITDISEELLTNLKKQWGGIPDIEVVYIGNINKIQKKYGPYAYHIIRYETGVLQEYCRNVAKTFGINIIERKGTSNSHLTPLFNIPNITKSIQPYGSLGLVFDDKKELFSEGWLSKVKSKEVALRTSLFKRYACRVYSSIPTKSEILINLVHRAYQVSKQLKRENKNIFDLEYLLVISHSLQDLTPGIYKLNYSGNGVLKKISDFTEYMDTGNLFNQSELGRSPYKIIPMLSCDQLIEEYGEHMFSDTLKCIASVIVNLWLELDGYGLAGTAAGGVIRCELQQFLPPYYENSIPLLSLCFGVPLTHHNQ